MKFLYALLCVLFLNIGTHGAPLPLLMAHAGASHAAPENTLASFKLAWKEGADGIEGDFQLTADGEMVWIHDADTLRVSGTRLIVSQTTWKDLAALDVGSWKSPEFRNERIPRLADVLDILPTEKWFFLEIKDGLRSVRPIRRILKQNKANPDRVILMSFDPKVVAACRKLIPDYQTHLLSFLNELSGNRANYKRQLISTGAQGLQFYSSARVNPSWLAKLHRRGLTLTAWTVDDRKTARKMIALDVDFLTTGRPGLLRNELWK